MKRLCCLLALLSLSVTATGAIVWEWECDVDPTTIDWNGDGTLDWIIRNGNPFDTSGLTPQGTWHATHQFAECVDNRPRNDYNTPTTVDLTWRSYGEGTWQATFWINVDYYPTCDPTQGVGSGYTFAPVYAHLELMPDQTQTLTLYNVFRDWEAQVLAQYTGLPDRMIDTRLYFDTVADTVTVDIDGVTQGTYSYGVFDKQNADNFCTVLGANGEFDYVRIEVEDLPPDDRIPEPASLVLVVGGLLCLLRRKRR